MSDDKIKGAYNYDEQFEYITRDNGQTWNLRSKYNIIFAKGDYVGDGNRLVKLNPDTPIPVPPGTYVDMEYPFLVGDGVVDINTGEKIIDDNFYSIEKIGDDYLLSGDNGVYSLNNRKYILVSGKSALYPTGDVRAFTVVKYEGDLEKLFLEIINRIVYPRICNDLMGRISFLDDTGYVMFSNNEKGNFVVGADDVYKLHRFSSIIDWENDVGMKKIGKLTYSDFIATSEISEIPMNDINEIKETPKVKELIKIVFQYICDRRQAIFNTYAKEIDDISVESYAKEIAEKSADLDERAANLEGLNMFINSEKGAAKLMLSDFITKAFTFDEFSIKSLINAAIYETIKDCAGLIHSKLVELHLVPGMTAVFDYNTYKFYYNFPKGLEKAVSNYMNSISRNAKLLNSENDKNLIKIAADYYNQYERLGLISRVNEILVDCEFLDTWYVRKHYQNVVDVFRYAARDYLVAHISDPKSSKKSALKEMYKFEIEDDFLLFDRNRKSFIETLNEKINTEIEFTYFVDQYDLSTNGLEDGEISRLYGYLQEIYMMFLTRVIELSNFLLDNFGNFENTVRKINNEIVSAVSYKVDNWIDKAVSASLDDLHDDFLLLNNVDATGVFRDKYMEFKNYFIAQFRNSESSL